MGCRPKNTCENRKFSKNILSKKTKKNRKKISKKYNSKKENNSV